MKCAVDDCVNNYKDQPKNEGITYHMFPKDPELCEAWMESLRIPKFAAFYRRMICSKHFRDDDFYFTKQGKRKLKLGAVPYLEDCYGPATLRTCKICLTLDAKMYQLKNGLDKMYQDVIGIEPRADHLNRLPMAICWECTARLHSAASFKSKALYCDELLHHHLLTNADLKVLHIQRIHQGQTHLQSSIAVQQVFKFNSLDDEDHAPNTFIKDEIIGIPNNEETEVELQSLVTDEMIIKDERNSSIIVSTFAASEIKTEVDLVPAPQSEVEVGDDTNFVDYYDDGDYQKVTENIYIEDANPDSGNVSSTNLVPAPKSEVEVGDETNFVDYYDDGDYQKVTENIYIEDANPDSGNVSNTNLVPAPKSEVEVGDETNFVDYYDDGDYQKVTENIYIEDANPDSGNVSNTNLDSANASTNEEKMETDNDAMGISQIMDTNDEELMKTAMNLTSDEEKPDDKGIPIQHEDKTVMCVKKRKKLIDDEVIVWVKGKRPRKQGTYVRPSIPIDENIFAMQPLDPDDLREEILARRHCTLYKNSPFKCKICYKGFPTKEKRENHVLKHSEESSTIGQTEINVKTLKNARKSINFNNMEPPINLENLSINESGLTSFLNVTGLTENLPFSFDSLRELDVDENDEVSYSLREQVEDGSEINKAQPAETEENESHQYDFSPTDGSDFDPDGISVHDEEYKYGPLKCNICLIHLRRPKDLRSHVKTRHTTEFICKLCPMKTRNLNVAREHMKYHNGSKYNCPQCSMEFTKKPTLLTHLRLKHMSAFVCELCGYTFVSTHGVGAHKRLKHKLFDPNDTEFTGPYCELCGVKFLTEKAYNRHLRLSSKHIKEDDPNRMSNDPSLKQRRLGDSNIRRVRRSVIDRKSYNEQTSNGPVICEQNTPTTGQKLFQCDHCNKNFTIKSNLAGHMSLHDVTRRDFMCNICGKQFTLSQNLTRHMFVHTGLKPFKCDVCEKTFRTSGDLRAHVDYVHLKKPRPKRVRRKANKCQVQTLEY